MQIVVRDGSDVRAIEATEGQTLLEALQLAAVIIDAPCGGRGTCMKCRVLVSDEQGVEYKLACQIPAADGMEVTVEHSREMSVSMGASQSLWTADGEPGTYGFAIDVGTTTVVCRLQDLSTGEVLGAMGCSNPQLAFGADVLSRISASDEKGIASMAALLGDALVDMATKLIAQHGIDNDKVIRTVLCGNTTMETLAVGMDPTPIGASPFIPPSLFGEEIEYEPFARANLTQGKVLFAPSLAAYVGGDITVGILAKNMIAQDKPTFLLDLGTNGEMALGNKNGIITCATAAGPVFEGANIKYGMPAYPGAISKIAPGDEPGTISYEVIGGGDASGVCGTGLFDIVAILLEHGIIDETGRMLEADEVDTGVSWGLEQLLFEEDGQPAFRLTDRISITQKDVRSLQLAKASVCAGILTLMEALDVSFDDMGDLLIAGGFGEYLDLKAAACVGIFPKELLDRAKSVGNTAIEGSSAMLVSAAAREEISRVVEASKYIELSTSAVFNELYIEQMEFSESQA